jgi:hypothetical protein
MAIVKASFTQSRAGAKASVRYMSHRPGKDGQRLTRELVGYDGTMKLIQAYQMIDEAGQGSVFYRLVISPDPRTEDAERDLHLREIIEKTMLYLEERFQKAVPFVAAEHDDHSPHRHTHILAVLPGRLSLQDLAALRGVATEAALFQRQERDLAQTRPIQGQLVRRSQRQAHRAEPRHSSRPSRGAGRAGSRLVRGQLDIAVMCPRCGAPLGSRQRTCTSCGLRLPRREGRGIGWEH